MKRLLLQSLIGLAIVLAVSFVFYSAQHRSYSHGEQHRDQEECGYRMSAPCANP